HRQVRSTRELQSLFEVIQGCSERFCQIYVHLNGSRPFSVVFSYDSNLDTAAQDSLLDDGADAVLKGGKIAGEPDQDFEKPMVERSGLYDVPARRNRQFA